MKNKQIEKIFFGEDKNLKSQYITYLSYLNVANSLSKRDSITNDICKDNGFSYIERFKEMYLSMNNPLCFLHDKTYNLFLFTSPHIKKIMNNPSQSIIKEKKLIQKSKLKVIDSNTFRWLATKPGTTFKENAVIKAEYIAAKTNKIVIADDSGICVHALNDFPGIYSARFMEDRPYSEKHKEINLRLENKEDRSAHYTCAIAFVDPINKVCEVFEGKCFGKIINPIEGPYGFGYDPIFVPNGKNEPFSLITEEEKNRISHRGIATQLLMEYLKKYLNK